MSSTKILIFPMQNLYMIIVIYKFCRGNTKIFAENSKTKLFIRGLVAAEHFWNWDGTAEVPYAITFLKSDSSVVRGLYVRSESTFNIRSLKNNQRYLWTVSQIKLTDGFLGYVLILWRIIDLARPWIILHANLFSPNCVFIDNNHKLQETP